MYLCIKFWLFCLKKLWNLEDKRFKGKLQEYAQYIYILIYHTFPCKTEIQILKQDFPHEPLYNLMYQRYRTLHVL